MFNVIPKKLPAIEPRFDEINMLKNMGCVVHYDLARDKGSKVLNLMNYHPDYPNLLDPYSLMNTDTNGDGVVDGWTQTIGAGITAQSAINENAQRIDINASTTANRSYIARTIDISSGETISIGANTKISGNVKAQITIDWYNGSTWLGAVYSGYSTPTSFTDIQMLNKVAPTNTTKVMILLTVEPNSIGSTGSIWFKNAVVVKAPTLEKPRTDGTVYGASVVQNGRYFDGVDDKVVIPDSYAFKSDEITVLMYLNPLSWKSQSCYINYGKGTSYTTNNYMLSTNHTGTVMLQGRNPETTLNADFRIDVNSFCMIGFNYKNNVATFVKNGIFKNSVSCTLATDNNTGMYIGAPSNTLNFANAIISRVLIFNRALSQQQIQQVFKMYAWRYGIPT